MKRQGHGARTFGPPLLAVILLGVSGCTLTARPQAASPGTTVTERVPPSALVAVVPGAAAGSSLAVLVAGTARPGEDVDILQAGEAATVVAAATSPAPAKVVVAGKPTAPGAGTTSFQQAEYHRSIGRWQGALSSAKTAVAARTRAALTAWASALAIAAKVGRLRPVSGPAASLGAECAVAASAFAALGQAAGGSYGSRRVVLLYPLSLGGTLPAGELTGSDVIVVTPFLPSAAALSTAQTRLLAAGAARASIVGPASTPAQMSHLVTVGLDQKVAAETLSGAALFANDSARLLPAAARELSTVVAPLREAGTTAVINGYASTTGGGEANYLLSYARAAAVAAYFEAHGIPASALTIVGHGATDLVAAGPSGANRRVVVVIDGPQSS